MKESPTEKQKANKTGRSPGAIYSKGF